MAFRTSPSMLALLLGACAITACQRGATGQGRLALTEAGARVPLAEIRNGGPPPDGIPIVLAPQWDTAKQSPFGPNEPVLGLALGGESRAYPYGILNWHEMVADRVAGRNVLLTYCPLCDTGIAFDTGKRPATGYGVSGKLFQSCLLFFERTSGSLWSQPWGLAVTGKQAGQTMPRLPLVKTTLGAWLGRHPESKILSIRTAEHRDYFQSPYRGYAYRPDLYFPVRHSPSPPYRTKEPVAIAWRAPAATGGRYQGRAAWVGIKELRREGVHAARLGEMPIAFVWDPGLEAARAVRAKTPVESAQAEGLTLAGGRRISWGELSEIELPLTAAFGFVQDAFFGRAAGGAGGS